MTSGTRNSEHNRWRRLKRSAFIAVLTIAVVLSAAGVLDRFLSRCGLDYMADANERYLDNAFNGALAGFLVLSGIKSGLAIVEGSSVGVGVNLQLGDVVQPAYDYVDMAWKASLAGSSVIVVMQLALDSLTLIDHWALTIFLCLFIVWRLAVWLLPGWPSAHSTIKSGTRFAAVLALMLYLILPLTVTGAAWLSDAITRPVMQQARQQFQTMEEVFAPEHLYEQFFADAQSAGGLSTFDLKGRIDQVGRGVKELMEFLKRQTELIAAATVRMIAVYLFDCIVFPLLFGLMITTIVKSGVRYLFELDRMASE